MSEKKGWDLTSTSSMIAGAEWLRKKAGAIAVVVIRDKDKALAADGGVRPSDAAALIVEHLPDMAADLNQARKERRQALEIRAGQRIARESRQQMHAGESGTGQ